MTENRKQWAALSWPDQPRYLSPEAVSRRAKVRIGVRLSLITLPVMLAVVFAQLAGDGRDKGAPDPFVAAAALFPGDKIGISVSDALQAHGLLPKGITVDCASSTATAGSTSDCGEYPDSGGGGDVSFTVRFVDGHGHFSFRAPGGTVVDGRLHG